MNQTLAEMTSLLQLPIRAKDGEGQPLPFYNLRPFPLWVSTLHCFDYSFSLTLSNSLFNPPSNPLLSLCWNYNSLVARFDVLTTVFMNILVFLDVTPCRLVNSYVHLQGQAVQQDLGLLDREDEGNTILGSVSDNGITTRSWYAACNDAVTQWTHLLA
jgi:hypothetical protein